VDLERAVRATFPNPDFVIENAKRVALADELSLLGGLRSVTTGTEARWWEPIWHELGGLQDKLDRGKVPTDTWHRSWNDATDALEYMGLGGPWIATVSVWAQEQRAAQRPTSVLAWLRDLPMHLEADDLPGPPVCISTIHGVKGCEFDAVILTGMNEGRLPAKDGKIAEDRRLFYVAATRARERLLLTSHGLGESFLGMPEFHQISRFLNEVELAPKIAILH
jgi:hypothetical protein